MPAMDMAGFAFPSCNRRSGFSLLELLVALSITALVVAAVGASFLGWTRAEERAGLAVARMRTLEFAIMRLRQTIGVSYVPAWTNQPETWVFNGQDLERPGEPFDALTFDSIGHRTQRTDAKQSELMEMTVFTVTDEAREDGDRCRILRLREGGTISDRFEVEGGLVYDLAYNVSLFKISYLDPDGGLKQEWKLSERGTLPCAVVIWLGAGCGEDEKQVECLFIPLELSNAQSCEFEQEQLRNVCNIQEF